jgi:hypothetical protein
MIRRGLFPNGFKPVLWMVLFAALISPLSGQDSEFGIPEAALTSENDVSLEQARSVALQMAQKRWNRPSLGTVIPSCDSDGNLTAYMFVFRLDSKPFGTDASIRARIRESRNGTQAKSLSAPKPRVLDPAKAHESKEWVPGAVPASSGASKNSSGVVNMDMDPGGTLSNGPWLGKGEYGTVVVSARKSRVPVPQVIHGLPAFYTSLEPAAEKHRTRLGGRAKIVKLIYLSPAEEYFELRGANGTVRVDAHSMEEDRGPARMKTSATRLTSGQKERNRRLISAQWEKYGVR